jgi:hypothetical protein
LGLILIAADYVGGVFEAYIDGGPLLEAGNRYTYENVRVYTTVDELTATCATHMFAIIFLAQVLLIIHCPSY